MGIRSTLAGYLFSKHSIYMYRERESTFARWYGRFARNVMDYTIRNYHFVDCSRWFDLSFTRSIFFPFPYLWCDWLNRSIRLDNILNIHRSFCTRNKPTLLKIWKKAWIEERKKKSRHFDRCKWKFLEKCCLPSEWLTYGSRYDLRAISIRYYRYY